MSKTKRKKPSTDAARKPHEGSDLGPAIVLRRGERVVEPASERGAPKRAVNADRFWYTLTSEQQGAAQLIRTAFLYATSGLFSRAQRYERVDRGRLGDHTPSHILDCRVAYLEWTERAGGARVDLVLTYVNDGHSCREIDAMFHMRSGTAARVIRWELDDVARIAPKVVGRVGREAA